MTYPDHAQRLPRPHRRPPRRGLGGPARGSIRWTTLLSAGPTDTDSLTCGVAELSPGDHFAPHRHPQAEVYFGLEGEVEVVVDGVLHRLGPQSALFIPGGAVHGIPRVEGDVRFLYMFATDRFEDVSYVFVPEDQ